MILAEAANSFWATPESAVFGGVLARLVLATALGAALGLTREILHKAAGLRTHMLMALGACLAVVAARQAEMASADVSRIIQGIVTGIGFLGAGTIIKASDQMEVRGLTTAASIWFTAILGVATALAPLWLCGSAALLAWTILVPVAVLETWLERKGGRR